MGRRKCTPKQLAALRRGREKLAHKRSKKRTMSIFRPKTNPPKITNQNTHVFIPGVGTLHGQAGVNAFKTMMKH